MTPKSETLCPICGLFVEDHSGEMARDHYERYLDAAKLLFSIIKLIKRAPEAADVLEFNWNQPLELDGLETR